MPFNAEDETDPVTPPNYYDFILNRDGQDVYGNLLPINSIDYSTVNKFLYTNKVSSNNSALRALNLAASNSQKQFFVEAIPIIFNAEEGKHIIYDNFITTTTIDLQAMASTESLTALDQYKYTVDDQEVLLMFDIKSPSSMLEGGSTEIKLYIPTPTSPDKKTFELGTAIYTKTLSEINYSGQNMISLPWDKSFLKENAYILELTIS